MELSDSKNYYTYNIKVGVAQSIQRLGYRLDGRGSIPRRGRDFISSLPRRDRFRGPPSFLSNGYRGNLPKGKAAECEHSPTPMPSLKMREAIPPLP
jgi:hypothetical protein